MFPTRQLGRALSTAAAHGAKAPNVHAYTAAGKRAVEELMVYLRAMKAAQRRWAREIVAHESHVRRLMLVEEQCRDKLKQQVLKGTHEHLKYLVNTDLMAVSQFVSPPSVSLFLTYEIPAEQITGFSVYVMGCMAADPSRLNVPLPVLVADLASAWAILPPTKKDAFSELAEIFCSHVPSRAPPMKRINTAKRNASVTATKAKTMAVEAVAASAAKTKKSSSSKRVRAHRPHSMRKTERTRNSVKLAKSKQTSQTKTNRSDKRAALVAVAPARELLRARAKKSIPCTRNTHSNAKSSGSNTSSNSDSQEVPLLPSKDPRDVVARSEAFMNTRSTPRYYNENQLQQQRLPRQPKHVVQMETDAMKAFARRLPAAEHDAFCNFAQESLHEMELALGASIIPVEKEHHNNKNKINKNGCDASGTQTRGGAVTAHSRTLPRGVRLFMKEWLPIAAEEWIRKTRRQKSLYCQKP